MSTTLIDSPLSLFGEASRPSASGGPRMTLEERLDAVLHAARSEGRAECPVCQATMRGTDGAATCGDCGSQVS